MCGACSMKGEMRTAYKIFVRKSEGERPLGRPKIILEWILKKEGGKEWT